MKAKNLAALLLAAVLSLAACGQVPIENPDQAPAVTTIKWALWDWDATVYYQPLIDAYTAKNPEVKIEYVDLLSQDYQTVLSTQLSGGADLDVLTIKDIPGYANLVKQGFLEPLSGYISAEGIDTSLYGGTVEQIK
ncbi:MAG: extracellular solute-binding protein, partial [Clostridiales bacterium]|nr:extracellular solute-binding protein [Clostridiales bacterium]